MNSILEIHYQSNQISSDCYDNSCLPIAMFYTLRIIIVIITSHKNITQCWYDELRGCVTCAPATDLALFLRSRSLLRHLRLRGSMLRKSRKEGREGGREKE